MSKSILLTQQGLARRAESQPDHQFGDLYPLICRPEWITRALKRVLSNQGSKTAGLDGVSRKDLVTEQQQALFIEELQAELKTKAYQPTPVKRVWIPKPGKSEKRGLGIPTIKDRVVQELLRMIMEPIWESDFLNCSYGFRPNRRTMDCIGRCYQQITKQNKYFWVIEGDIRKCFDRINHNRLIGLLWQRLNDHHLINLVKAFLQAGVIDHRRLKQTHEGTPQGGILSPLLANIYLHELDMWWHNQFGVLTPWERKKRRKAKLGNAVLVRYADDFIFLWNGRHSGALEFRDRLEFFLADKLDLELAKEKTYVTHVTDGFDFLGFHIQRRTPNDNRNWLRVTPTRANIKRFKARIKALTGHYSIWSPVDLRFQQINRLIRGWGNYYQHVNFKVDACNLDWWINQRVLIWLGHKHQKRGVRWLLKQYKVREKVNQYNRWNFGVENNRGDMIYIAKLADIPLTTYRYKRHKHPYLTKYQPYQYETPFVALPATNIDPDEVAWRERKREVLKRDGFSCTVCGTKEGQLDVHHVISKRNSGSDELENLVTLCLKCHQQTKSYGKQPTGS